MAEPAETAAEVEDILARRAGGADEDVEQAGDKSVAPGAANTKHEDSPLLSTGVSSVYRDDGKRSEPSDYVVYLVRLLAMGMVGFTVTAFIRNVYYAGFEACDAIECKDSELYQHYLAVCLPVSLLAMPLAVVLLRAFGELLHQHTRINVWGRKMNLSECQEIWVDCQPTNFPCCDVSVVFCLGLGLALITLLTTMWGARDARDAIEARSMLAAGFASAICPLGDPLKQRAAGGMWVQNSHVPPKANGICEWQAGLVNGKKVGHVGVNYHCLSVAPVLAPKTSASAATAKCVFPDGQKKVSYWALYSGSSEQTQEKACAIAAPASHWKKGGIFVDPDSTRWTDLDAANLPPMMPDKWENYKGCLQKAKADFLNKNSAYSDDPHSKYVVLSNNPKGDVESLQSSSRHVFAVGVMSVLALTCIFSALFNFCPTCW